VTRANSLGYIYARKKPTGFILNNLYIPRCKDAKNLTLYYQANEIGNITLGVGCAIDGTTFTGNNKIAKIKKISGITTGVNISTTGKALNNQSIHNLLYSFATDVRTYGHPSQNKNKTITFPEGFVNRYLNSDIGIEDKNENTIICIEDNLTKENTIAFEVGEDELTSFNNALKIAENIKKPLELYDAFYNSRNNKRYYITELSSDGLDVTTYHVCDYTPTDDGKKAKIDSGNLFELLEKRNWEYA
jgi:hypothetical protein